MKIHLIGVGGAAMGNLAAMLKQSGHRVSGSDQDLYPPMSDRLKEWKIDANPFSANSVKGKDLIIVGNAISRGNVELEAALRLALPITSMAAALEEFFLKGKQTIVVAGTHGKTTTTFLTDYLIGEGLRQAGRTLDLGGASKKHGVRRAGKNPLPGLFVGGVRADGHAGFRIPDKRSPYFVIEGDEYDTAFFDKASKFLHYRPHHLILTSVEYDHADIFADFEQYKKTFRILLRWIPPNGSLIACGADAGVLEVTNKYSFSEIFYYGGSGGHRSRFRRKGRNVHFDLRMGDGTKDVAFDCAPNLIGSHNSMNATAACLVGRRIGLSPEELAVGLESFPGVLRRQQLRQSCQKPGGPWIFMEDFAHHPTAVSKTIEAVREAYPKHYLIALYEPRSATSHRSIFAREYVDSLAGADLVLLPDVFNRNKVAAADRLDVAGIVKGLKKRTQAEYCKDPAGVLKALRLELRRHSDARPVAVLAMSNGGFGGIYPEVESLLSEH